MSNIFKGQVIGEGGLAEPGLTPVEAAAFLHEEFPDVPSWTFVDMEYHPCSSGLTRMVGGGLKTAGAFGRWKWERISTRYPRLALWEGRLDPKDPRGGWVGAIRVSHGSGTSFVLFSYLNHKGNCCDHYLASTADLKLLRRFIDDARRRHDRVPSGKVEIYVVGGQNIRIPRHAPTDSLVLDEAMIADIDRQVAAFFEGRKLFKQIGARHQRGFLFVGPPGTGKTMMMRRIVRNGAATYRARAVTLVIKKATDEDDLARAFRMAELRAPSILLLDDVDSLTKETGVSRSAFLSLLDGLKANKGILVVGAANNPGDIDPALLNRPSRFDRVWTFPLPGKPLRLRYLARQFPTMDHGFLDRVAARTTDWSYAYLNELRTSAAILANGNGMADVTEEMLLKAADLLGIQFEAGRKSHIAPTSGETMGFRGA